MLEMLGFHKQPDGSHAMVLRSSLIIGPDIPDLPDREFYNALVAGISQLRDQHVRGIDEVLEQIEAVGDVTAYGSTAVN